MESIEPQIRALSRRLLGLQDVALRAKYLRHMVLQMPPAAVAEMLMLTVSGAETRDQDYAVLLQCLSLALTDRTCDTLRADVGRLLDASDQRHLAYLLCGDSSSQDASEDRGAGVDLGLGRPITLGERKSLARRRDRDLLARMLRDPHPDVIEIWLDNPTVTESDVLRLCAQRPIAGEVVRRIFGSPRWVVRYAVKVALALNTCAPLDVRMQLAPHLSRQDLLRLMQSPNVPLPLMESCRRMLGQSTLH